MRIRGNECEPSPILPGSSAYDIREVVSVDFARTIVFDDFVHLEMIDAQKQDVDLKRILD
jgi:hypothetical protein